MIGLREEMSEEGFTGVPRDSLEMDTGGALARHEGGCPRLVEEEASSASWKRSRASGLVRRLMSPSFKGLSLQGWAPGTHLPAVPEAGHEEGEGRGTQGDQGPWRLLGRPLRLCFPPALGLDSKRVCKTGNLTDKGKGEGAGKYPVPIRILGKHAAKTGREKNGKKERKTNCRVWKAQAEAEGSCQEPGPLRATSKDFTGPLNPPSAQAEAGIPEAF